MNNHINSQCISTEDVVSYLYGELPAVDSARFERHSATCVACADEIAGLGGARRSIGEWKAEFDVTRTPSITIPASEARPVAESHGFSLFDRFRSIFGGIPAFAAGALAVAVIGVVIFAYLATGEGSPEIAGGNQNRPKTVTSPTANPVSAVRQTQSPTESVPKRTVQPEAQPAPVRSSDKRIVSERAPRQRKPVETEAKKIRKPAPGFVDEADTEDDTLRLADLFDEIGTESSLR